ncbi:AAA family ATPase [Bacillus velezensis]|uniref:ATP-binding protein n=1 Tax=Bacillus velezensis TaxID=492670 RepID=UPI0018C6F5F8|nr:ATP-binding protein [Bacillus velezensis]QPK89894.1 AAA family ATPase [Bacillus velezensis]
MDKLRFIMMVGLAGSGKSTVAKELAKDRKDIVIISSDNIRLELFGDESYQGDNAKVFEEMRQRAKKSLKDGKHVVYDATNINRKKRKALLSQLPKDVEKIALYMAIPYKVTLRQNEERERSVPVNSIFGMYKNLQIPIYSEGWDKIIFEYDNETLEDDLPKQYTDAVRAGVIYGREGYELMSFLASEFMDHFFGVYDMPQDSKHHSLSVSRHIYYVYRHILENYEGDDKEMMLWAALLHDIGKEECKSFYNRKGEEARYANFIGHEYVGSQKAVTLLKKLNFGDEFIHNVVTLVQFHMYLLDENANREKLKAYVGEEMYKKLEFLREADTLAH